MPRRRAYVQLDEQLRERQEQFEQQLNAVDNWPLLRDFTILQHLDYAQHRLGAG